LADNLSKTFLLIAIAMCGAIIVVLSFMNWVDFAADDPFVLGTPLEDLSFTLDGTDVSRIQGAIELPEARLQGENACTCRAGFGDGYITAIFGAIVVALASVAILLQSRIRVLTVAAILASLVAFGIAGYNATGVWEGVGGTSGEGAFLNLDGDVRIELFTLTALAALAAVLGAAVIAIDTRDAQALAAADLEAEEALEGEEGAAEEVSG
jgi:hypothetical protein